VVLSLVLPGAALAQGGGELQNPFSPGLPQNQGSIPAQTQTQAPLVVPTSSSGSSSGISGASAAAIGIGALLVLGGISFFIWRDARKRAPVRHHAAHATAGAGARSGSKRPPKPRKLSRAERKRRKRGRAR